MSPIRHLARYLHHLIIVTFSLFLAASATAADQLTYAEKLTAREEAGRQAEGPEFDIPGRQLARNMLPRAKSWRRRLRPPLLAGR